MTCFLGKAIQDKNLTIRSIHDLQIWFLDSFSPNARLSLQFFPCTWHLHFISFFLARKALDTEYVCLTHSKQIIGTLPGEKSSFKFRKKKWIVEEQMRETKSRSIKKKKKQVRRESMKQKRETPRKNKGNLINSSKTIIVTREILRTRKEIGEDLRRIKEIIPDWSKFMTIQGKLKRNKAMLQKML